MDAILPLTLPEAEAQLDRAGQEIARMRLILDRLCLDRPGACAAPAHVTPAMANRILGKSTNYVSNLVKAGKVQVETHWGTKLVPMAEVVKLMRGPDQEPDNA